MDAPRPTSDHCGSLYPGGHGEERECVLPVGHAGAHDYAVVPDAPRPTSELAADVRTMLANAGDPGVDFPQPMMVAAVAGVDALVARVTDLEARAASWQASCEAAREDYAAAEAQVALLDPTGGPQISMGTAAGILIREREARKAAEVAALTANRDAGEAQADAELTGRLIAAEAALATTRQALAEIRDGYDGDEFEDSADAAERFRDLARRALAETDDQK